jgi:hypothetical protein
MFPLCQQIIRPLWFTRKYRSINKRRYKLLRY